MKSVKFLGGLALLMILCCPSFVFGESVEHSQPLSVGSVSNLPASLMTLTFAPGGNLHHAKPQNGGWGGGGGGGNGGCGQGGNGGWNSAGNGWGGGGGNGGNGGCVPEGGTSFEYLAFGALACIGAMAFRARRQGMSKAR